MIFIFESDPVKSKSQQCFLEAQDYKTQIIKSEMKLPVSIMKASNIAILDMSSPNEFDFAIIDKLIKAKEAPKLLITTSEAGAFVQSDSFHKSIAKVLFEPVSPLVLIEAISRLYDTTG